MYKSIYHINFYNLQNYTRALFHKLQVKPFPACIQWKKAQAHIFELEAINLVVKSLLPTF